MGIVNFGINRELVKTLAQKHKIKNFIETGTYLGETTVWASSFFDQVHTIEISEEIYNKTSKKYKEKTNIHFHFGDSKTVLPKIIPTIKGTTLFWLDGHWCGRDTGGKFNECPIFSELDEAVKTENPAILIDDLRYFLGTNPYDYGENYPTLHDIIKTLTIKLPTHFITIHDDTLICVPQEYKNDVDNDWKKYYNKRYPSSYKSMLSKILWRIKHFDFVLEKNK
jgi:hypothetical protein